MNKKKFLFIVNPISGGKSKRHIIHLLEDFAASGKYEVKIQQTRAKGDATVLARESDADVIVAVGGDGTVHEVAQGLLGLDKVLGIIPCGSGNGLALHLGISRNPRKAIRTLLDGTIHSIDYGLMNRQPFFCTIGMGLDACVAWDFATTDKRGLWTYISLAWMIWRHYQPAFYTINLDGVILTASATILTIGNANQWGNNARITSLASVKDGLLDLCVVAPFKTIEIPVLAMKLLTGQAHTSHKVRMFKGKEIVVHRESEGPIHCDGNPSHRGTDIRVISVPAALNVIIPANKDCI